MVWFRGLIHIIVSCGFFDGLLCEFVPGFSMTLSGQLLSQHGGDAMWVKDIDRRRDKVKLSCPADHVIYDPQFLVGARTGREVYRRTVSSSDCLGLAHDMQAQVSKCFWQRRCTLDWLERMPIVTSLNSSCVGKSPDYVILKTPLCVPKDNIITMCDECDVIVEDFGILRSHTNFPWKIRRKNFSVACRKTLIPKPNHALFLYVEHFSITSPDRMTIFHVTKNGSRLLSDGGNPGDVIFSVTSGRLIVDYVIGVPRHAATVSGFVLRFEQKRCQHQSADLAVGVLAARLAAFGHSPFQARASISHCLSYTQEHITLTCPPHDVIFRPDVRHGTSGRWRRRGCKSRKRKSCKEEESAQEKSGAGLVARQCEWRGECRMWWNRSVAVDRGDRHHCGGRQRAGEVQLRGVMCVPEDSVFDICNSTYDEIRTTRGYLRSHAHFPWTNENSPRLCRKRICVHRKFGLRMSSKKLDLSARGRGEHLKVWTVDESNVRGLLKVYKRGENVKGCFTSGCVDVEYRRRRGQHSGSGFVLQLQSLFPVTEETDDFFKCGKIANNEGQTNKDSPQPWRTPRAVPCRLTAEDLQNNPLRASCSSSKKRISSISVVGHSGRHCQGLTPDLFVQMNACFWQKKCTLTYNTQAPNYMLKLYKGTMSDCVVKQPQEFVISYECTSKKVKRLHLLHKRRGEREEVVRDKQGVVVSHGNHPWLYRRHHDLRKELTLQTPPRNRKRYKVFLYTIRSLSLMSGDNLTVHWTTASGTNHSKLFSHNYDLSTPNSRRLNISQAVKVVFSFDTAVYTNGGEGFVICFRWSKKVKRSDTCKNLLVPQNCTERRQNP